MSSAASWPRHFLSERDCCTSSQSRYERKHYLTAKVCASVGFLILLVLLLLLLLPLPEIEEFEANGVFSQNDCLDSWLGAFRCIQSVICPGGTCQIGWWPSCGQTWRRSAYHSSELQTGQLQCCSVLPSSSHMKFHAESIRTYQTKMKHTLTSISNMHLDCGLHHIVADTQVACINLA